MVIIVMRLELMVPAAGSLKDKRMVLKSIKDRVRNRFNVSISEVDNNDKWQRATVAVAGVSNDKSYISGQMDDIIKFIENSHSVEIINIHKEEI